MIRSFADKRTQELYATGKATWHQPDLVGRARRRLEYLDLASRLEDLLEPPSKPLHGLHGGRKGQHSIAVNDQWRICFIFEDGDAYDVAICDYH